MLKSEQRRKGGHAEALTVPEKGERFVELLPQKGHESVNVICVLFIHLPFAGYSKFTWAKKRYRQRTNSTLLLLRFVVVVVVVVVVVARHCCYRRFCCCWWCCHDFYYHSSLLFLRCTGGWSAAKIENPQRAFRDSLVFSPTSFRLRPPCDPSLRHRRRVVRLW